MSMKQKPTTLDVVVEIKDPVLANNRKEISALAKLVKTYFEGNWDKAKAFRIVISENEEDDNEDQQAPRKAVQE